MTGKRKDTGPEIAVAVILDGLGVAYDRNVKGLVAMPSFLLTERGTILMVDGDASVGRNHEDVERLPDKWRAKIEAGVRRDVRQRRALRRAGWSVHRLWEGDLRDRAKVERRLSRLLEGHGVAPYDEGKRRP